MPSLIRLYHFKLCSCVCTGYGRCRPVHAFTFLVLLKCFAAPPLRKGIVVSSEHHICTCSSPLLKVVILPDGAIRFFIESTATTLGITDAVTHCHHPPPATTVEHKHSIRPTYLVVDIRIINDRAAISPHLYYKTGILAELCIQMLRALRPDIINQLTNEELMCTPPSHYKPVPGIRYKEMRPTAFLSPLLSVSP